MSCKRFARNDFSGAPKFLVSRRIVEVQRLPAPVITIFTDYQPAQAQGLTRPSRRWVSREPAETRFVARTRKSRRERTMLHLLRCTTSSCSRAMPPQSLFQSDPLGFTSTEIRGIKQEHARKRPAPFKKSAGYAQTSCSNTGSVVAHPREPY
jgi:hypothetical protein